jgi:hypothetical protein
MMTMFKKMFRTLIAAIEPEAVRQRDAMGPHSIYVDTRPFNVDRQFMGR